jgi:UDP-N-acetylglucosamine--N-acetylmuramyl-(pentapeptide) pyrophosphoryl-undecaprenol N-acetylglucosamine transferase
MEGISLGKQTLPLTVVFTGGGTGGHIYPGLAVADELIQKARREYQTNAAVSATAETVRDLRVVWFGSKAEMDRTIVEKSSDVSAFYAIPAGKFRRYVSIKTVFDLFKIAAGFFASIFLLLKVKPAALFSKGGYVSVPPCFAAKLLSIPVYTHECDFTPGLATKLTSRTAKRIFVSYPETARYFPTGIQNKITVTGNPIRPVFYETTCAQNENTAQLPTLLIIGGSLGARQINELVTKNLDWLCERFTVVHQTGNQTSSRSPWTASQTDYVVSATAETTSSRTRNYRRVQFFYSDFPDVLKSADVVLSRAGASAVWECAVCGKPMVLSPLGKQGSRGDQIDNAAYFAERGAALVLDPDTADSGKLKAALETTLDVAVREKMRDAALSIAGKIRPAQTIADILYAEVHGHGLH